MQVSNLAAAEFRTALDALGVTQHRAGQWFGVNARSIRRWQRGDRHVPRGVGIVLRLLAAEMITVAQVEEVTVPVPARTNGAKPEPPASLRVEPAPEEQPALAPRRAGTVTLADPSPTTSVVEQICALTSEICHWPLGIPGQPGFRFCGSAVVTAPYCPRHRAAAYLARQPGRGHGSRIGFVVHGRHGPSIPTGASRAPKVLFDAGDLPGSAPPPA
jgi:hypothetical protein